MHVDAILCPGVLNIRRWYTSQRYEPVTLYQPSSHSIVALLLVSNAPDPATSYSIPPSLYTVFRHRMCNGSAHCLCLLARPPCEITMRVGDKGGTDLFVHQSQEENTKTNYSYNGDLSTARRALTTDSFVLETCKNNSTSHIICLCQSLLDQKPLSFSAIHFRRLHQHTFHASQFHASQPIVPTLVVRILHQHEQY